MRVRWTQSGTNGPSAVSEVGAWRANVVNGHWKSAASRARRRQLEGSGGVRDRTARLLEHQKRVHETIEVAIQHPVHVPDFNLAP